MTREEMNRTMQFILEQQAQFTVNMQKIEENLRKTDGNLDRLTTQHAALEDVVIRLAESHIQLVSSRKELLTGTKNWLALTSG